MSFKHMGIVWHKELLDTIRERRTLVMMIVVPLVLMPVFVLGPSLLESSLEEQKQQEAQEILVLNPGAAPDLIAQIRQSGVLRIVDVEDPERALKDGEIAVILAIPPDFARALATESGSLQVDIRYDATDSDSRAAEEKLAALLHAYRQGIVQARLQTRGLSPELLEPFAVRSQNVASQQRVSGFLLSFLLPLFLVLWASIGGSQTAIDVSAGEKERGTLESLLVSPPGRSSLVAGKFLAVTTVTLGATTLSLVGFVVAIAFAKHVFAENTVFAMVELSLDPGVIALLFGVTALVAAMMSALTFSLYAWTRNFKEAQTYSSYVSFVVMIPAFLVAFTDPPASWEAFLIPIYNATAVLKELILGDIRWSHLALTLASSAAYAGISLALAVRVFQSERVLFRR